MHRGLSFVAVALLLVFLTLPSVGIVLWMAVVVFHYAPPLWLVLVVDVGILFNLAVVAWRLWYFAARAR